MLIPPLPTKHTKFSLFLVSFHTTINLEWKTPTIRRTQHAPQPSPNQPQPWPTYGQPVCVCRQIIVSVQCALSPLPGIHSKSGSGQWIGWCSGGTAYHTFLLIVLLLLIVGRHGPTYLTNATEQSSSAAAAEPPSMEYEGGRDDKKHTQTRTGFAFRGICQVITHSILVVQATKGSHGTCPFLYSQSCFNYNALRNLWACSFEGHCCYQTHCISII